MSVRWINIDGSGQGRTVKIDHLAQNGAGLRLRWERKGQNEQRQRQDTTSKFHWNLHLSIHSCKLWFRFIRDGVCQVSFVGRPEAVAGSCHRCHKPFPRDGNRTMSCLMVPADRNLSVQFPISVTDSTVSRLEVGSSAVFQPSMRAFITVVVFRPAIRISGTIFSYSSYKNLFRTDYFCPRDRNRQEVGVSERNISIWNILALEISFGDCDFAVGSDLTHRSCQSNPGPPPAGLLSKNGPPGHGRLPVPAPGFFCP